MLNRNFDLDIKSNYSLEKSNTFGLDIASESFFNVKNLKDLKNILSENKTKKITVLRGGSNILFTKFLDGLCLKIGLKGIDIIEENKNNPFFLYVPHPQPHVPLFASSDFNGKTGEGLYADVITEIDYSVGRIIDALEKNNLSDNTIVVFTSDNGPWLSYGDHAGSSGIYREGKGTTWEGGVRVPCIIKYSKKLNHRVIDEPVMGIDWLPTFADITNSQMSENKIDGKNIWPLLSGNTKKTPHEKLLFYYRVNELHSIRMGDWKMQFPRKYRSLNGSEGGKDGMPVKYQMNPVEANELYNLINDPEEKFNVYDLR